jgi:hypothetical protein
MISPTEDELSAAVAAVSKSGREHVNSPTFRRTLAACLTS